MFFFTEQLPCSYITIGAGVEDPSKWRAQHNPEIVFNEKALPLGTAAYVQVAMDYLEKHGK